MLQTILSTKQKQTHSQTTKLRVDGVGGGRGRGKGYLGVWDGHVHAAVLRMDDQQGPTGEHGELCLMSCGGLDGRGVLGRMDTCI